MKLKNTVCTFLTHGLFLVILIVLAWQPATAEAIISSPDLVVISPDVSNPAPVEGEAFTISATVQNIGDAASSPTTLNWYLSGDASITPGDLLVDTDAVFVLEPGATSPESTQQAIPDAGTYWVGACVEDQGDESNAGNQCSSGARVDVGVQDLIFTNGFE